MVCKCVRGTNKVEGGPHGDIYRKFGALHGELRFQVFVASTAHSVVTVT